jgi:hypothetical protein
LLELRLVRANVGAADLAERQSAERRPTDVVLDDAAVLRHRERGELADPAVEPGVEIVGDRSQIRVDRLPEPLLAEQLDEGILGRPLRSDD